MKNIGKIIGAANSMRRESENLNRYSESILRLVDMTAFPEYKHCDTGLCKDIIKRATQANLSADRASCEADIIIDYIQGDLKSDDK